VPGGGYCQGQLNPSRDEDFVTPRGVRLGGEFPEIPGVEPYPEHRKTAVENVDKPTADLVSGRLAHTEARRRFDEISARIFSAP
jgi:hypothetical protein